MWENPLRMEIMVGTIYKNRDCYTCSLMVGMLHHRDPFIMSCELPGFPVLNKCFFGCWNTDTFSTGFPSEKIKV